MENQRFTHGAVVPRVIYFFTFVAVWHLVQEGCLYLLKIICMQTKNNL